jgi:membrane protein
VLFSLARAGFVAYVSNASYNVIYGALATMPLFLLWLYLVWIVILLGASLAASLTTFSDYSRYDSSWPYSAPRARRTAPARSRRAPRARGGR